MVTFASSGHPSREQAKGAIDKKSRGGRFPRRVSGRMDR